MSQSKNPLPRWRGFNLLEMFTTDFDGNYREDDFRWMADWGFDFVRIPMSYHYWTAENDVYKVDERMLEKIDTVVQYGEKHGIHVNLNFHRAPGYCVNPGRPEPFDLWKDQAALDAFCWHWELFAKRYRGISSDKLSFDLVNEPGTPTPGIMTVEDYERVVRAAVSAIRSADPNRLIIADGLSFGNDPIRGIGDLGIGQSCRAYLPFLVSHYKAGWVNRDTWNVPAWPCDDGGDYWDRERLDKHYSEWAALMEQGIGVHCGEGGAYKFTPHDVVLNWLDDVLDILTSKGIGYSIWNFRGEFGILDSGRADVAYEDFHGHKLDRKLLKLLQKY